MLRFRTAAVAAVAALATAGGLVQPAEALPLAPSQDRYAALGDSFAAGVGNPPLSDAGDSVRSAAAYPVLLAGGVNNLTFLASSGATTALMTDEQVPQIPRTATQVTLTAGGNDVGFGTVAAACTSAPDQCTAAVAAAQARIPAMVTGLTALITQVRSSAPEADIYVTGYPQLFQAAQGCSGPLEPLAPALTVVDAATLELNSTIAAVAAASNSTYVDVVVPFTGHGICQGAESWILGPQSSAPLHPNERGQQAYAAAVAATSFVSAEEGETSTPSPSASPSATPSPSPSESPSATPSPSPTAYSPSPSPSTSRRPDMFHHGKGHSKYERHGGLAKTGR